MMNFQTVQKQFLAHLRDPINQPIPNGFTHQGIQIYVDLLYTNFNESLERCFPLTHQLVGEEIWQRLVKSFITEHSCQSPYYRQLPEQFISYLQAKKTDEFAPPYLLELAHFEWIELALTVAESDPIINPNTITNDWLVSRPLFAPVFAIFHYQYPVQLINSHFQPTEPPEQPTHILGFRDKNDVVQFIELEPATSRLLEILYTTDFTVLEAVNHIAIALDLPNPSVLFSFVMETMEHLMQQGAIYGQKQDQTMS